jgi:glycine/D-amino acid oxidase-like deaminating enzyme
VIYVVGGGVMGCTLTYRLAARGLGVTLIEQGQVGSGASGVPVALLNPYRGRSARASAFDLAFLAAMWQLVAEIEGLGHASGVYPSGVLRIAPNARQAKTWSRREGVRWLEPGAVPAGYHAPFGGFVVAQGGWLEPRRWLGALSAAARQRGATVLEGCAVEHIDADLSLRTAAGTLQASAVVLCTGAGLTLGQGVLGLEHVAGEVIGLETRTPPPYPLAGAVYGAALGKTFYLGGNHRPAGQTDTGAPVQLQRAGGWFIPAIKDAPLRSVWHGIRIKAADNLPVVRELRPGLWFAGALAGRGFLCAAHVAAALSERIAATKA